ncbi:hypothetical protein [uncultured Maribacter sp.]|uniref:hypothetical protein n=1 Tax=uncultured Maribacter sp. TaxID=431308 RepID=UPI00262ECFFF|nr:hypothetical protein [uncultured Maribacter sp.]
MKKVKIFLIAILALSIGTVTAHDKETEKDRGTEIITAQIHDMLADQEIPDNIRGAKAEVKIALADDGIYRLLSVNSNNENLKHFLKDGIDFQNLTPGNKDLVYVIPIEIAE